MKEVHEKRGRMNLVSARPASDISERKRSNQKLGQEKLAVEVTRFISENIANLTRKLFMCVSSTRSERAFRLQVYPEVFDFFEVERGVCCRPVIGLPDSHSPKGVTYDTVSVPVDICSDDWFWLNYCVDIQNIVTDTCAGIIVLVRDLRIADRTAIPFLVDRFTNTCIFKIQRLYNKACPMHDNNTEKQDEWPF